MSHSVLDEWDEATVPNALDLELMWGDLYASLPLPAALYEDLHAKFLRIMARYVPAPFTPPSGWTGRPRLTNDAGRVLPGRIVDGRVSWR